MGSLERVWGGKKCRKISSEIEATFVAEEKPLYMLVQFTYAILLSLDMYLIELVSGVHALVYCTCTLCVPHIVV